MAATALAEHPDWEGKRYTLTDADTEYSIAIKRPAKQVVFQVIGSDDVRLRLTTGDMGAADDWTLIPAGSTVTKQLAANVNSGNPPTIYLGTGGASVVVIVTPEPVRGV